MSDSKNVPRYMDSKQWRAAGYKTIFKDGYVFLYRPLSGITYRIRNDNGKWMGATNINLAPWENVTGKVDEGWLKEIAANCYCDQGVGICDFCGGDRAVTKSKNGNDIDIGLLPAHVQKAISMVENGHDFTGPHPGFQQKMLGKRLRSLRTGFAKIMDKAPELMPKVVLFEMGLIEKTLTGAERRRIDVR